MKLTKRRSGCHGSANAGFTLLELLAALVVMGFVIAMLVQGARFGVQSMLWANREDDGDRLAVNQAFKHMVEQADPGVYPEPATLHGTGATLTLTTELPGGSGAPIRADAILAVSAGRLILRWRPHAHVVWFGPGPDWTETVMADDVDRVEFAYYPGAGGLDWSRSWAGERLPALVRMTLVFAGPKHRHWPPMIAAALREAIEE